MANRFCSGCGAKLVSSANFCVECGERQAGARPARRSLSHLTERYAPLYVLGIVLLIGTGAVVYGMFNEVPRATVPRRDAPPNPQQPQNAGPLPGDHPPLQIPEEVKATIRELAKKAADAPDDLAAWKQIADVQYRAGQLDPQYLTDAAASYRHIIEKDPNNLDAIRGIGNVAYDQQQPEVAIKQYQLYLDKKPDDLEVRTDLGTMYLSSGNSQKALEIYENVLKSNPQFFQAQFNLAIAHRGLGNNDKSQAALEKARELAPDDRTRNQVDQLIARLKGQPTPPAIASADPHAGMVPGAPAVPPVPAAAPAAPAAPAAAAAPVADNFQAAAQGLFQSNPIMGPKVQRVEWTTPSAAKVYLRDFPMDQMGPGMQSMFADRMKGRLKEQKTKFNVTETVKFELIDEPSGRVMDTLTE